MLRAPICSLRRTCGALLLLGVGGGVGVGGVACAKHVRPHPHATTSASIDLAVGQATSIPTEGLREYGIDGQGLVGVRRTKDMLVLTALRPGTTAIYLVDREGAVARREIHVTLPVPRTRGDELADELASFRCFRVVRSGERWTIEATPLDDTERLQLEELKDSYAAQSVDLHLVPRACPSAPTPDAGATPTPDASADVDASTP
ncbi:MAG: hypothetical protein KIT84_03240 [Labilithrix sp.]|nr:hypothetical protein [Labilithrix sp.]MCW5809997.1 hypothetical protein [Labilithrix sp.]